MRTRLVAALRVIAILLCGVTSRAEVALSDSVRQNEDTARAERCQIQFDFDSAIAYAKEAMARDDFHEAESDCEKACAASIQNPTLFNDSEHHELESRLEALWQQIAKTKIAETSSPEGRRRIQAEEPGRLIDNFWLGRINCNHTIGQLTKKSRELIDNAQYAAAKGVVNQILILDPQNQYAISLLPLLSDRMPAFERRSDPESYLAAAPDWLLIPLVAALPLLLSRLRARATSDASLGVCLACGYDLRATPHRCPECGTIPIERPPQSLLTR